MNTVQYFSAKIFIHICVCIAANLEELSSEFMRRNLNFNKLLKRKLISEDFFNCYSKSTGDDILYLDKKSLNNLKSLYTSTHLYLFGIAEGFIALINNRIIHLIDS